VQDLPRTPIVARRRRRKENWIDWVSAIVVHTLFVLWWVGLIHFWPADIPLKGGGDMRFAFAPELQVLYWPVLGLSSALIGVNLLKLASRESRPIGAALHVVVQLAVVAMAAFALHVGHWVVATGAGVDPITLAKTLFGVNLGVEISLIVTIAATLLSLAVAAWRLWRREGAAAPATNGA
jgi:hypothetical protein